MNIFRVMLLMFILASIVGVEGNAATVTVDPGAGGDYLTLKEAVDDIGTWSSGTDNTIEMVNGSHAIAAGVSLEGLANQTLRIQAASGADPVLAAGPGVEDMIGIAVGANLTVVIDGLLFVGFASTGHSDRSSGLLIRGASSTDVTIRNCVFTANDGGDGARLDYVTYAGQKNFPQTNWPDEARMRHGIVIAGEFASPITVTVEDSVFFATSRSGIHIEGTGTGLASGSTITCDGALFIQCGENNINFTGINDGVSVILRNTLLNANGFDGDSCIVLRGPDAANPSLATLTLEDSIIWHALRGTIASVNIAGIINLTRCTLWQDNGDSIEQEQDAYPPRATYNFTDTIIRTHDGTIRFRPENEPNPFTAMNLDHIAVYSTGVIVRPSQSQSVRNAFSDLNGGAGPLAEDPQFSTNTFDGVIFNGLRKWNSEDNNFLDVGSSAYLAQASDGGSLTGGAEITVNPVQRWTIFK